jgi:hypothetical protein
MLYLDERRPTLSFTVSFSGGSVSSQTIGGLIVDMLSVRVDLVDPFMSFSFLTVFWHSPERGFLSLFNDLSTLFFLCCNIT